jgi:hypothetical protein
MATYNKINDFTERLMQGVHVWNSNTFKVALSNAAVTAGSVILGDVTQITQQNGYTTGGYPTSINALFETTGTTTVQASQVVFTASGGTIGPFRYVVLYNDTATTPGADPLIAWWDYGSSIALLDGETFTVKFNNANPGTIFTLA